MIKDQQRVLYVILLTDAHIVSRIGEDTRTRFGFLRHLPSGGESLLTMGNRDRWSCFRGACFCWCTLGAPWVHQGCTKGAPVAKDSCLAGCLRKLWPWRRLEGQVLSSDPPDFSLPMRLGHIFELVINPHQLVRTLPLMSRYWLAHPGHWPRTEVDGAVGLVAGGRRT